MSPPRSTEAGLFVMPDDAVGTKFSDTLDIDQEAHLLYMGDNWSGGIDVFDISTPEARYLTTVTMRGVFAGVCVAKPVHKLYVGTWDAASHSSVAVIDIDPNSDTLHTVVARVDVGGNAGADLLDYDPVHRKIYAGMRNEGFLAALDAETDTIVGRIGGLGLALEQPRYNAADGMVYLAGREDNVLYQVDPVEDVLVATFDIGDACNPNGLAINPEANQAVLACSNRVTPHAVVWDLSTQTLAEVVYETGKGDGAVYSAAVDRAFFAADGYTSGPVIGVFGGNPIRFLGNIETGPGASWVAFDETHNLVYAPAIEAGKPALRSYPLAI